jgi:hypothetical protein
MQEAALRNHEDVLSRTAFSDTNLYDCYGKVFEICVLFSIERLIAI